jgi:hypothetical protein
VRLLANGLVLNFISGVSAEIYRHIPVVVNVGQKKIMRPTCVYVSVRIGVRRSSV